jgi:hypothetical protein
LDLGPDWNRDRDFGIAYLSNGRKARVLAVVDKVLWLRRYQMDELLLRGLVTLKPSPRPRATKAAKVRADFQDENAVAVV